MNVLLQEAEIKFAAIWPVKKIFMRLRVNEIETDWLNRGPQKGACAPVNDKP